VYLEVVPPPPASRFFFRGLYVGLPSEKNKRIYIKKILSGKKIFSNKTVSLVEES